MKAKRLTAVLNVSNIAESFAWFEKLGWKKAWDWGAPPDIGGVCSGECEIFLCENGQGGRGKGAAKTTFGPEGDQSAAAGVWMCILMEDNDEEAQTPEGGDGRRRRTHGTFVHESSLSHSVFNQEA